MWWSSGSTCRECLHTLLRCHPERSVAESKDPVALPAASLVIRRDSSTAFASLTPLRMTPEEEKATLQTMRGRGSSKRSMKPDSPKPNSETEAAVHPPD